MPNGFNALVVLNTFLAVLIAGTVWKLLAMHMMATGNPTLVNAGRAMAFQY